MLLTACLILGALTAEPQPGLPDGTSGQEMLTVPAANQRDLRDPQQVLLERINDDRARAGLKPLAWDARMAEAARDHAEMMADEGRLSHQFDGEPALLDRLTRRSVRLDTASENVVYDVTPEGAHEAFVKSAPHRGNPPCAARMARSNLTQREHQILQLVAKGLTNKEIGRAIGISDKTARNHVNSIIEKLEVSDRTEAATIATSGPVAVCR